MKTRVTQTSIDSYNADIKANKEVNQTDKVLNCFKSLGGLATINEIGRKLKIPSSTVSARLSKLYELNKIHKTGKTKKDSVSQKRNELIGLVDAE